MSLLFRCDGSETLGMGHIVRCLALAKQINQTSMIDINFAIKESSKAVDKVNKHFNVFHKQNGYSDADWLFKCLKQINVKVLIIDTRDNFSLEKLNCFKAVLNFKIVTLDDPEDKRFSSDIAFYPPVPQIRKMNLGNMEGKVFVGFDYVIISEDVLKQKINYRNRKNILLTTGWGDNNGMLLKLVKGLNNLSESHSITIIVGGGFSKREKLKQICHNSIHKMSIIDSPEGLGRLLNQSKLVITSFGVTAYESAALGIPTFHLCPTKDHYESSEVFLNDALSERVLFNEDEKNFRQLILELDSFIKRSSNLNFERKKYNSISNGIINVANKIINLTN